MRKIGILLILQYCYLYSCSQYSLTGNYSQDFNSLLSSGSGNGLPSGWMISETGSSADGLYIAGTGSASTGDTYSFGSAASPERAFGTLQSGTLQSLIGFYFTNATGNLITRITLSYTGEQWRLGATGRNDRLDFQFSLNATSLTSGDWVNMDGLDFTAPVSSSPTGAMNGNADNNKRLITATITGIFIAPGSTCFFRWSDADASGSDDGLSVDDLSIEPGFTVPSSLFYRSKSSGNWSALSSWEVSGDELNWTEATELPGWYTAGIRIRTGHNIIHQYFAIVDQLIIESGGLLQHSGGQFSIYEGTGDDLQIENGGIFQLAAAGNPPLFVSSPAVIKIKTGGLLRISAGGLSTVPGAGVHAANYIYSDGAILENAYNGMGANGVTYFPNVNSTTIPVLRITQSITLPVGAVAPTRVNGLLEVNGNISFTASGQKIFRNGITGSANISSTATCGLLLVDGITALLGGTGQINLTASAGLQVGNGTTLTLQQDKTINGNIILSASSSFIELGTFQLEVSGTISGGGSTSFIRTAGTGSLVLENVGGSGKLFPVGHSRYNPVLIENGSGHSWNVRVNDGVVPDIPYTTDGAVLLTWYIQPVVNPPVSGADITFRFDQVNQTGSLFTTLPFDTEPVQAWHRSNGFWLSAGVPQPLVNAGGDIRTVRINGLTAFSPYGLTRLSLPLPVKLLSFQAIPSGADHIRLVWRMAEPGSAMYIPEYALNGLDFIAIDTLQSSNQKTDFICLDKRRGIPLLYYRLKIVEPDGTIRYSEVVKWSEALPDLIRLQLLANPVTQDALLQVINYMPTYAILLILDPSGKQFYKERLHLKKGEQHIPLNLSHLSAGVYYLHLQGHGWTKNIRFIKQ